ncbi:hypothetical protein GCM10009096_01210 [Parasphingorhabdus litoris]|uniref:Cytochrome c domain-containing protein n=1 Tax=Parasphingorhabdus litoris TaxID=394733 RepID=A0ABN1A0K1_9SPHN|nr:c-type cytochrome [Parasphingorhabdus litoris]
MRIFVLGIFLPLAMLGCAAVPTGQNISDNGLGEATASGNSDPIQGLTIAQAHCAACHAVEDGQISSNEQAPPFHAIANTEGLTDETLTTWLSDSHNYPDLMDFDIESTDIDALAAYILTLQSADYKPPIQ